MSRLLPFHRIPDAMGDLGANLRIWRMKRNLTQAELGACTGHGPATIANLENGRVNGSADTWMRVDEALDAGGELAAEAARLRKRMNELPRVPKAAPLVERVGFWGGGEILLLRQAFRLTRREFAAYLGVCASTLHYWEHGRRAPRVSMQQVLDEALSSAPEEAKIRFSLLLRKNRPAR